MKPIRVGCLLLPVFLISCDRRENLPAPLDAGAAYTLVEVASYGWEDLDEASRSLSEVEVAWEGAVLGAVGGIAEGPRGEVVVVDRAFQKVVVFDRTGALERLIPAGSGQGPGEFVRPRSVTMDSRGRIAVLDGVQRRISLFAPDGAHERDVLWEGPGMPFSVVFWGDDLYMTALTIGSSTDTPLYRVDVDTGDVEGVVTLEDRSPEIAERGEPGALGLLADSAVIYGHPVPGMWTVLDREGRTITRGTDIFPWLSWDTRPAAQGTGEVHFLPVYQRAIGQLDGSNVSVIYAVSSSAEGKEYPSDPGSGIMAATFHPNGDFLALSRLLDADARVGFAVVSALGPELIVSTTNPYPRVVRYRVEPTNRNTVEPR